MRLSGLLLSLALGLSPAAVQLARAQSTAATFGQVISLGGTPSDMVLDEFRGLLYLVNANSNRVDIFNTASKQVVGSIAVGNQPLAAAMSMDGGFLYVTNSGSSTLSMIDLGSDRMVKTVAIPSKPEGVEVGLDGRVLVSTQGTQSLYIFDPAVTNSAVSLTPVLTPPPPSTPSVLPAQTLTRPQTTFNSKLLRTPDGQFIVGLTNPGNNGAQTYLFVYEVASGSILRSRTTAGQSTVLSMSPDGSRFMAGYTMFDTATLSVLAQQNNANAPFTSTATFSVQQNVGGSVYTPDGATLYSAFNVAAFTGTNPLPRPLSSTLFVNDSRNLAIRLGIRLPESIVAKMVATKDGADVFSLSQSGLLYLPMSTLYNYPIIQPETTQVFLSVDPCNRGLASGTLKVNNLGKGKLTFGVNNTNAALVTELSSGLAPGSIKFTMEPGRTSGTRQSGTNLIITPQTLGTPISIQLSSLEAINIPNVVRVYMNYRSPQGDERGIIYPIPTTPNNTAEELQDIVLDQARSRVYITNSGYNRIEVFDTVNKAFLDPIPVNQLPHQMALSTDGNTLYVGGTGGELVSTVDLSQNPPQLTGNINFPPLPRQGGGVNAAVLNPRSLAYGYFGLQFVMSNGSQWKLVSNTQATVRPTSSITGSTFSTPTTMVAAPDAAYILTLAGNGNAYLYDASADAYVSVALLFGAPVQGYYGPVAAGPGGSYFLAGGVLLNQSLTVLAGDSNASATQRNVYSLVAYDQNSYLRFTTSFRASIAAASGDEQRPTLELVNIQNGQVTQIGPVAEQPRQTFFGTTRTNVPARTMAVDANTGTAYILTMSGLTVVPLTLNGVVRPQLTSGVRSVVNAADNSTTLRPGSFINVNGAALAESATASALPAPTVLGGSCVTFNDVTLPLFKTSDGQIVAQIPANVVLGTNVVQVRSLANGLASDPVVVSVLPAQ